MAHSADEEERPDNLDEAESERLRQIALSRGGPEKRPILRYVFLGIALLALYSWGSAWYGAYDSKRIDPVVTQAVLAHAVKGTRIPVTLWSGPRILVIKSAFPQFQPKPTGAMAPLPPTTLVAMDVLDPKTGKIDPKYSSGIYTVIDGVAVTIK
jgi:hypothetical protein